MFLTSEIRTWVNGHGSVLMDAATKKTILERCDAFDVRRGRGTPVTLGEVSGWIFSGFPRTKQAFLDAHPRRDARFKGALAAAGMRA